ncbi:hypothetical protein B4N89_47380 [Embleya scabrispora]|uniref:REase associating with pPIWI RE domain-containing protein n=1 Tax=Embleya scabrispora TaxID=159449 RepID=A0A1T3NHX0_9ACTN|nr:hypothetical protein B4N89_47380 [Embleya scabrispora]
MAVLNADDPRSWRELARMHGVVLGCLPPGEGPATPAEFRLCLRLRLRDWVPLDWSLVAPELGDLAVLVGDGGAGLALSDEAFDVGQEYVQALFDDTGGFDGGREWLPSWAWQTAEQVERTTFRGLAEGDQAGYVAGRRMLIEVAAATEEALLEEYLRRGAARLDAYEPIPDDRVVIRGDARWWWPCPECGYPMLVDHLSVRCPYRQHRQRFLIASDGRGNAPVLFNAPRPPKARRAERVWCVRWGVWRHITVPGRSEVPLLAWLDDLDGVEVVWWQGMDAVDLAVTFADGSVWTGDVKDIANIDAVVARPPRADFVLLPRWRSALIPALRDHLPAGRYTVCTIEQFKRRVKERVDALRAVGAPAGTR